LVPLAKNVKASELDFIVRECDAKAVFCSVEQLPAVAAVAQTCPSVSLLIAMDYVAGDDAHERAQRDAVARLGGPVNATTAKATVTSIDALEARGRELDLVAPEIPAPGEDPLLSLVYTSGSTGTPKGAMFGERSWHARWATLPFMELTLLPMVSVVFLPQNHMGGRNAVANSLKLGGVAYFTFGSDMSTLFEDIRLIRPTYIHLVPRLSELIYQHFQSEVARRGGADAEARVRQEMSASFLGDRMLLALTAAAPTPPDVLAFVKSCFEIPVVNVFAGTEYGQMFIDGSLNRGNVLEFKLVSVPELGYSVTDSPYPRGELHVKTARGISSYFKNETATATLFDEHGFMRTGDIFEQRGADEMVWIDRKNNVLKLAQGEFVNIWKLEALFSSGSRLIKQVYLQGSSVRAYLLGVVVPELSEFDTAERDDDDALKALLRNEITRLATAHGLEPYEIPRDFLIEREAFSRDNGLLTSLGKPARPALKRVYGEALERLYEAIDRLAVAQLGQILDEDRDLPLAVRLRRRAAATLGLSETSLDVQQSFRAFGGDSIAASNFCAAIHTEHGVKISVGAVLAPELSLDALLRDIERRVGGPEVAAPAPYERIHGRGASAIFTRDLRVARFFPNLMPAASSAAEGPSEHVLLTGATGFLGRFLCVAALEETARRGGKVTCVVRAGSDEEAARRLAEVYGSGPLRARFEQLAPRHLSVVAGDLETPRLGLPASRYDELAVAVDTVVHAGALVNHAMSYAQLFEPNVQGTAEVLRFALEGRRKRVSYMSTNSVSLALLGERAQAKEADDTRSLGDGWRIDGDRHANGYQASKWASEVLAQDLAESYDLAVNVFRCNLILPPERTREQINTSDFLTRLAYSVVHSGVRPASLYERGAVRPHLDGFPVDFMAAAILAIARRPSTGYAMYHVNNVHWGDGMSLDTVLERLSARGYPLREMEDHDAWFATFQAALRALPAAQQAASSLPIIAQWRTPLVMERRQRIDASEFRAKVRQLRPLERDDLPSLDEGYFDRYLEDLIALGVIPSP
jgi:fatty acid CoA ligase FadD9